MCNLIRTLKLSLYANWKLQEFYINCFAILGRITVWTNMHPKPKTTGERSMPPKLGNRLRIGRSKGSVIA